MPDKTFATYFNAARERATQAELDEASKDLEVVLADAAGRMQLRKAVGQHVDSVTAHHEKEAEFNRDEFDASFAAIVEALLVMQQDLRDKISTLTTEALYKRDVVAVGFNRGAMVFLLTFTAGVARAVFPGGGGASLTDPMTSHNLFITLGICLISMLCLGLVAAIEGGHCKHARHNMERASAMTDACKAIDEILARVGHLRSSTPDRIATAASATT